MGVHDLEVAAVEIIGGALLEEGPGSVVDLDVCEHRILLHAGLDDVDCLEGALLHLELLLALLPQRLRLRLGLGQGLGQGLGLGLG